MAIVVGVQSIQFWAFANAHGMHEGILPPNAALHRLLGVATVERGLITAAILLVIGLVLGVLAVSNWSNVAFGLLDPTLTMRLAIPSAVCIVLAFEIAYGAFVLNVLGIRESRPDRSARPLVEQPSA
jgi:Na+-translocating ferredoxin:NAD+ oxidoreductase RnfE subunit